MMTRGRCWLNLLQEEGLTAAATVMVGDREHDIHAAKQNSLRSIGVTYGYGSVQELTQAGADLLCHTPQELACLNERRTE